MLASHRRVTGNIAAAGREQAVSRAAGISDKTWVGLINGKRKGARDKGRGKRRRMVSWCVRDFA